MNVYGWKKSQSEIEIELNWARARETERRLKLNELRKINTSSAYLCSETEISAGWN